jgi:hypothetical protein
VAKLVPNTNCKHVSIVIQLSIVCVLVSADIFPYEFFISCSNMVIDWLAKLSEMCRLYTVDSVCRIVNYVEESALKPFG